MAHTGQYKSFTTRRFRADLHYRMRLLAASTNRTQQDIFNDIVQLGLDQLEKQTGVTVGEWEPAGRKGE